MQILSEHFKNRIRKFKSNKEAKLTAYQLKIQQIEQELSQKSDAELKELLQFFNKKPDDCRKKYSDEQYNNYIRYGDLTVEQSKKAFLTTTVSTAIADGLGGFTITVNLTKTIFQAFSIGLGKIAFEILTVFTGGLALILGSIVIYSLYRITRKTAEKNREKLYFLNAQQRILHILNLRKEEANFNKVIQCINSCKAFTDDLAASESYKRNFARYGMNEADAVKLGKINQGPGWLARLKQEAADGNKVAENKWSTLNRIFNKLTSKQTQISLVEEQAGSAFSTTKLASELKLDPAEKIEAKPVHAKKVKVNPVLKHKYTLPVVTGAGMGFTMFAMIYLGGAALLTALGTHLGIHALIWAAGASAGPVGIVCAALVSIGFGLYFGYKYYRKFKEIKACAKEINKTSESVENSSRIYAALKKQGRNIKQIQQRLDFCRHISAKVTNKSGVENALDPTENAPRLRRTFSSPTLH